MDMFCADTKLNISRAYLRPGFAFGGACLAKDVKALALLGRTAGIALPLLSNIENSNEAHLRRSIDWLCVRKIMKKFDIPIYYRSPVISVVKNARKITDPRKKDYTPSVLDFGPVKFLIARHFGFCYGV